MKFVGIKANNMTIGINLDQVTFFKYDKEGKTCTLLGHDISSLVTIPDEDGSIYNTLADTVRIAHWED